MDPSSSSEVTDGDTGELRAAIVELLLRSKRRIDHVELTGEILSFPLVRTPDGPMWLPPGGQARGSARVVEHDGVARLVGLDAEIRAGVAVGAHWHDCAERLIVHRGALDLGWIDEATSQERSLTLTKGSDHSLEAWALHWARYREPSRIQCDFISEPGQPPGLGVAWVPGS